VPTEVFVGFVSVALTWIFKDKQKEKEIARIRRELTAKM